MATPHAALPDRLGLARARDLAATGSARTARADVARLLARVEAEVAADPAGCLRPAPSSPPPGAPGSGPAMLVTSAGTWAAGRFETPTLSDLAGRVAALRAPSDPAGPAPAVTLSVLQGTGPTTDIGTLQAADDGAGLFQVASQFNGLEAPGAYLVPVADYPGDPTQGPRASVSAFPGTFLRHYRAPGPDGAPFVQGAPGPDGVPREVDLLADALGPAGRVVHGYLRAQDVRDPTAAAARLDPGAADDLSGPFGQVRVGLHAGVEVVFGHDWGGPVPAGSDGRGPRIAQAFTSTLALGGYSRGAGPAHRALAGHLLRAAYLGTLLGALALGRRRAVLTLIGGGVFGNPRDLIWAAILWAVDRATPLAPAPLDVLVNARADLAGSVPAPALRAAVESRGGVLLDA